jgi:hypothetical protein
MKRTRVVGGALAALVGVAALVAALPEGAAAATSSADLQAVRVATARYHSYIRALKDGYSAVGEPCVASPDGTMGVHAPNGALIGDPAIDPLHPEIMLYLPGDDGSMQLIGVEYFAVALANTPSGPAPWFDAAPPPLGFITPTPSVLGHDFDGPMAGHNPAMPWHYDLHVWLWANNPSGMFAMFNPALSCP